MDFGGNGFLVSGAQATVKRSTVEAVGGDSFVVVGARGAMSGNSAAKGQGSWSAGPMRSSTPTAQDVLGAAFLVNGDRAR